MSHNFSHNISQNNSQGLPAPISGAAASLVAGTGLVTSGQTINGSISLGSSGIVSGTTLATNGTFGLSQAIIPERFDYAGLTGVEFDGCRHKYVSDYNVMHAQAFHLAVWKLLHEDVEDNGFVILPPSPVAFVAFGTEESLEDFEQWMAVYRERYGESFRSLKVPPLRKGPTSGELVDVQWSYFDDKELAEQWAWIYGNCSSEVFFAVPNWILFTEVADAVAYRLRFHG